MCFFFLMNVKFVFYQKSFFTFFFYHVDPGVQDMVVEALHPIRYKDLPTSGFGPLESFLESCRVVNKRTGSGIILNTPSCLESSSLSWMHRELGIPMYALGPLHALAKAVKSS